MEKILGIDLGSNSVGWAIRDINKTENQIIDKGVLIFDKGVGEVKGIEIPLVKARTDARGKRRNYQAEKYRKWSLLEYLIETKMCPLKIDELNEWRKYVKGCSRKYPQSTKFIQWLRFDFNGDGKPDFEQIGYSKHESYYLFRVLAASETEANKKLFKDNPYILGRVLYQLVQRRGFRGRDDEEAKTIMEGSKESGAIGVETLRPFIEKYKTLGTALYYIQKETNTRIRKRYNLRSDYENELKTICHIHSIDEVSYKKLWKAIIWQRPLRSQKGLIGKCMYESNKTRCPVSHPLYEEFRTWVFINNLKILLPEDIDKQKYIIDKIYPIFYNTSKDFKIEKIIKVLNKDKGIIESKFRPDSKAISCYLQNQFNTILGNNWKEKYGWHEVFCNNKKKGVFDYEDIWHVLFTFDNKEKLKDFGFRKLGLNEEKAIKFSSIKLQQGYATLSLAAIKKLLPYLERGFVYSEAVYLANLDKVLNFYKLSDDTIQEFTEVFKKIKGEHDFEKRIIEIINNLINEHQTIRNSKLTEPLSNKRDYIEEKVLTFIGEKTWNERLTEKEKNNILNTVVDKYEEYLQKPVNTKKEEIYLKSVRLHDRIFSYLKHTYNVPEDRIKLLWHPSEQDIYQNAEIKNGFKKLGDPQPLGRGFKNPMALRTLHELKKLVNYLMQKGKIDENTRIVVEIARELNDSNKRKAIERYQREREKENDEYRAKIKEIVDEYELNIDLNDKLFINKYRLWLEQNQMCIYTGKIINCTELFDGSKYDLEHTIPASMSFDNELKNLTIADKHYNSNIKKNDIPFNTPNYNDNVSIDGVEYTAIKPRIKFLEDKVEHYEKLHEEWRNKSRFASTKEIKDACIQKRHIISFDLDYWRKKLQTFTFEEYKTGWRNSQLKDTQIVTKYALPYLKTVFKRVDVQKGSVTAAFREIYSILERKEKKNRDKHSHHAIDAAVLTLIPPPSTRDIILERYNEEKDKNIYKHYHETPTKWKNYDPMFIQDIENDVIINYQKKDRVLTNTFKNIRKRGKQQFVKFKSANGKMEYKLNENGKKIPMIAKGDSIRGQLHKESLFGSIRIDNVLWLVERYPINTFSNINDCKHIIDKRVREIVRRTLQSRIDNGTSFDKAKFEPIYFENNKTEIKKVRCKVAAGRGYLTKDKSLTIKQHTFLSKHTHKQNIYAQNEENYIFLLYEGFDQKGKTLRAYRILNLFEVSSLHIKDSKELLEEKYYKTMNKQIGNKKHELVLSTIIKVGNRLILFDKQKEELSSLTSKEIYKRLYSVFKFNEPSTAYIFLKHHSEARPISAISTVEKNYIPDVYQPVLALTADKLNCLIEHKDFTIYPDGEIKFN